MKPGAGNAALDQGVSQRGEEKWSDLDCILKVEATGFADGLSVRDERRGSLAASKDLGPSTQGLGDCYLLRYQTIREKQDYFFQREER